MGKVVYSLNVSLDGFVETPDHSLDWAIVDEELHSWFNDRTRDADAFVWGRRMYELMVAYWPTAESDAAATPAMREFARLANPKPKFVFSSTLTTVEWNGRLVQGDARDVLGRLQADFDGELQVGGPTLAAEFIRRGLVDEFRLVVHPVVIGAGTPFFPPDVRLPLRLIDSHQFESGVVYLGYAVAK
jgi:dihydrofolate reductase